MELDRLSNELDAFIEKTKHATIEESEVPIFFKCMDQCQSLKS